MNTTTPHITRSAPQSATLRPTSPRRGPASIDQPSWPQTLIETVPIIDTPAFFGPPINFLLGPWVLLVLLLMGPFALVVTIVLALALAAGLLALFAAVLASPYLLIRHLQAHRCRRAAIACAPAYARWSSRTAVAWPAQRV